MLHLIIKDRLFFETKNIVSGGLVRMAHWKLWEENCMKNGLLELTVSGEKNLARQLKHSFTTSGQGPDNFYP